MMDDKISLMFAVEAERMLTEGLTDQAIEVCRNGIGAFPEYPSGYAVLAKALESRREYSNALEVLDQAATLFPANKYISVLRKEIFVSAEAWRKEVEVSSDIMSNTEDNIELILDQTPVTDLESETEAHDEINLENPLEMINDSVDSIPMESLGGFVPDISDDPSVAFEIEELEADVSISNDDIISDQEPVQATDQSEEPSPEPDIDILEIPENIEETGGCEDISYINDSVVDVIEVEEPDAYDINPGLDIPVTSDEPVSHDEDLITADTATDVTASEEAVFEDILQDIDVPVLPEETPAVEETVIDEPREAVSIVPAETPASIETGIDEGLINYVEANSAKTTDTGRKKKLRTKDYQRHESELINKDQFLEFNPVIEVGSFYEIEELWQTAASFELTGDFDDIIDNLASNVRREDIPGQADTDYEFETGSPVIQEPEANYSTSETLAGETLDFDESTGPGSPSISSDEAVELSTEPVQDTSVFARDETAAVRLNFIFHDAKSAYIEDNKENQVARPATRPQVKLVLRSAGSRGQEDHIGSNDLKASNLNLIPGLHFSPLKVRGKRLVNINHLKPLPEPPEFPEFARKTEPVENELPPPAAAEPLTFNMNRNLSLKDLADQIKNFGMTAGEDILDQEAGSPDQPKDPDIIVTETMAKIYMMQHAYSEAAEAYRILAGQNPGRKDYFLNKAAEAEQEIDNR